MCPQLAGSGETALNFIVDENGADFVTAGTKRLEELRGGDVDATFTLDGLDENTACIFRNEISDPSDIVVGTISKTGDHRGKRFLVFRVRRCGQGAHCPAME